MHPSYLLDDEDRLVLQLWSAFQGGGLGGAGHLPFGGGIADQPSALIYAFSACDDAAARVRAHFRSSSKD